jgi:hypothetical protein
MFCVSIENLFVSKAETEDKAKKEVRSLLLDILINNPEDLILIAEKD